MRKLSDESPQSLEGTRPSSNVRIEVLEWFSESR